MAPLIPRPDGTHAEDAPIGCPACDLMWPFDGTPGRVQVGTSVGGGRTYRCEGCGHVTDGRSDGGYTIGQAPDGVVPPPPPRRP